MCGFVGSVPAPTRKRATGDDEKLQLLSHLRRRQGNTVLLLGKKCFHLFDEVLDALAVYLGRRDLHRFFAEYRVFLPRQYRSHSGTISKSVEYCYATHRSTSEAIGGKDTHDGARRADALLLQAAQH